ncbi:CheR family methyltransferase [Pseudomonas quasicaspiana]|uniref:CheR family methyltransferase n=1 Tax=Pseudomonas quasicaspiana TaxID=2829821 RepID=UPI000EFF87D4|nr:protein-glutamate O-methyltransferase CheR [Pseudomonas quasicaspiana]MCD5976010.1 chemotaxis protein CheR [Pseudomonas quasicaspiana]
MSQEARFFGFLKDRIGLDVASIGEAIVERAIRQRYLATKAIDSDGYWQLLQSSAEEQQALIEAVIVPETWFFRYPESFVSLGNLAKARIAELNGVRPIRILSLPCSTGEEPYSIAMALLDAGALAAQFTIDAMDISPISIQRAERGVYGKNSFRGDDISYRDRYFNATEDGFELQDRVRERISFRAGNLLDPALTNQTAYDFVFCRNLLIYFDQPTQKHVFEVLKRLTRDDGILFIGPAEGSLLTRMGMRSIGIPQTFAFSHYSAPQEPVALFAEPSPRSAIVPPGFNPRSVSRTPPRPTTVSLAPTQRSPSVATGSPVTATGRDDVATLLATIASLANEGKSADARAACERFLKSHEPVAQVFYWLGLLSEVEGSNAQAQGFYRKALYLQPQHPEALAQLAALLAAQGDSAGARRLNERAARSVNKQGGSPR